MPSVLVTGVAGRIGSVTASRLKEAGFSVAGLDRRRPEPPVQDLLDEVIVGSASDTSMVRRSVRGKDAVVHLAAIPSPEGRDPTEVFSNNVETTFNVLDAAASAGAKAAVIASSICALGLVFAPEPLHPDYAPLDEQHPLRPADPYGLSKQCDELTAAMVSRRSAITVLAYRFPFTNSAQQIVARSEANQAKPAEAARELWAYLDVRDAAEACLLGISAALEDRVSGHHVLNIVAEDSLVDEPLGELVHRFHPGTVLRRELGARSCAYDTSAARRLLGFSAKHLRP